MKIQDYKIKLYPDGDQSNKPFDGDFEALLNNPCFHWDAIFGGEKQFTFSNTKVNEKDEPERYFALIYSVSDNLSVEASAFARTFIEVVKDILEKNDLGSIECPPKDAAKLGVSDLFKKEQKGWMVYDLEKPIDCSWFFSKKEKAEKFKSTLGNNDDYAIKEFILNPEF